ncbi:hypothetical protein BDK51DRAFT_47824 [Blyttiomyces helicus]|uniref:MYND-type domain-containing protein n=1 Tax=Blyttiomyces helicus TaxID=388810 RepID=A0A4P9WJ72_9FUNG|nr:hypothetical protein BDK51DRAFT_47824 [Blyttiomyces helicus]|eukprot:RKO91528.1 hypothetical protein BDK51DRAFT_47824 [Blyttiomyces helicus]
MPVRGLLPPCTWLNPAESPSHGQLGIGDPGGTRPRICNVERFDDSARTSEDAEVWPLACVEDSSLEQILVVAQIGIRQGVALVAPKDGVESPPARLATTLHSFKSAREASDRGDWFVSANAYRAAYQSAPSTFAQRFQLLLHHLEPFIKRTLPLAHADDFTAWRDVEVCFRSRDNTNTNLPSGPILDSVLANLRAALAQLDFPIGPLIARSLRLPGLACDVCGTSATTNRLRWCGTCKRAAYCSTTCQEGAWERHGRGCRPPGAFQNGDFVRHSGLTRRQARYDLPTPSGGRADEDDLNGYFLQVSGGSLAIGAIRSDCGRRGPPSSHERSPSQPPRNKLTTSSSTGASVRTSSTGIVLIPYAGQNNLIAGFPENSLQDPFEREVSGRGAVDANMELKQPTLETVFLPPPSPHHHRILHPNSPLSCIHESMVVSGHVSGNFLAYLVLKEVRET